MERWTVIPREPFALLLIGLRVETPWRVGGWLPALRAMGPMLEELRRRPELGFLGGRAWFGRTSILVQHWRDQAAIEAYAAAADGAHLPASRAFLARARAARGVGLWHESYAVAPGGLDALYLNMPPFLASAVFPRVAATGPLARAAGRREAAVKAASAGSSRSA